ncbi:MAG: 50S ribosomal protein L16 [Nanoarchaeota archaeon]|nr:50S ribosomal protein L16 [Nanoarchaeota archaeon]MBU1135735.1 50S ribosomal protein L16 [Nanoarchaeota archaeon]MBU2520100.1 50S ribosomal protein L16 [Nanoarchaeota archaeon]
MGIRPARCYKKLERPYTRQSRRKPKKGFVKGVPGSKIHRFEVGNSKGDFPVVMYVVAKAPVQIRHNALESARINANKTLNDEFGKTGYFLKVRVFPHHVMRENPLASGAGADRFQTGMRKAFGRPIGTAAQVKAGQKIIEARVGKGQEKIIRKALKKAAAKLPVPCNIESA